MTWKYICKIMAVRHQGKTCISDIWVAHRNSLGCVFYKSTNHIFGLRSCWSSLSQDCGNPVTLCLSYYSFIIGKKSKGFRRSSSIQAAFKGI